jgi:hypothetical protein
MSRNRLFRFVMAAIFAVPLLTWYACKKYKDPEMPDISLDGKYCNNPLAFNFNWGFPGTPDSTVCLFPTDKFTGIWQLEDSIYAPDETLLEVVSRTITFTATEDTLKQHMRISGWCTPSSIAVRANKFGLALTDTLIEFSAGAQIVCNDTLSGSFYAYPDTVLMPEVMKVNLTRNTSEGMRIHRGTAIKQ